MSGPVRVQLSRKKGWRMPENTVSVARPGRWGTPFVVGSPNVPDRAAAVRLFRAAVERNGHLLDFAADEIVRLNGKNLACWCPLDQPCHADVLLEIANSPIREVPRP